MTQLVRNCGAPIKAPSRGPDALHVEWFALILVVSVPALYGLFWWLDYRWLAHAREQELAPPPAEDDD